MIIDALQCEACGVTCASVAPYDVSSHATQIRDTDWSGQAGMDSVVEGSSNYSDLLRRRGLALGDVVALTLFAYVGKRSHGSADFDLDVFITALPFYAGMKLALAS